MTLLRANRVTKSYGAPGSATEVRVLRGIDLVLEAGESLAVVGPSGCGKSTLLNIIAGLDHPTSGDVLLDGEPLHGRDEAELARLRNRKIGFVFQQHHLLPQCTLWENVILPTLAFPLAPEARQAAMDRAEDLLRRVRLADRRHHRPGRLSGGEAQRAAVVRSLVNGPRLLLADEPTGSLDPDSARSLGDLLGELSRSEGVAMIVVTHSMELAHRMGTVRSLSDGRLE